MKSELHQRIRAARNFADLSQQAIAKACGVTRPAVSQCVSAAAKAILP